MLGLYGLSNLALNTVRRENLSVATTVSGVATASANTTLKLVFTVVTAGPATAAAAISLKKSIAAAVSGAGTITGALSDKIPMISGISAAAIVSGLLGFKITMDSDYILAVDSVASAVLTHTQNRTRIRNSPMSAALRMRS